MLSPQLTLIDLGNVREQLRRVGAVAINEISEALEKFLFGYSRKRSVGVHGMRLARGFSRPCAHTVQDKPDPLVESISPALRNVRCRSHKNSESTEERRLDTAPTSQNSCQGKTTPHAALIPIKHKKVTTFPGECEAESLATSSLEVLLFLRRRGRVRLKAPVLKTGGPQGSASSNLAPMIGKRSQDCGNVGRVRDRICDAVVGDDVSVHRRGHY